ncbi:hypothetical protein ACTHGU_00825 [Chitinophagaceae bacterium MMS25-I14]
MMNSLKTTLPLKALEDHINNLQENSIDSMATFSEYNHKNISYYEAADNYAGMIQDSTMKSNLRLIIGTSKTAYDKRIAQHTALQEQITARSSTLSDLHIMLKIVRTLPLIQQYQEKSLPSVRPMQNLLQEFNSTVEQTGKTIKK